jgi:DNA-binding CsgD family transcriptional regulator
MRQQDAIPLVDEIYRGLFDRAPAHWLAGVVDAVHRAWPGHVGVVGYAYAMFGDPAAWQISEPVAYGGDPELAARVKLSFDHAPPAFRAALFPSLGPVGTFSEATGRLLTQQHRVGSREAKRAGASDAVYLNAVDPDGRGVLIAINLRGAHRLATGTRRVLSMIAAHVGSARRLVASKRVAPRVILGRAGRVEHVEAGHEQAAAAVRGRWRDVFRGGARAGSDPEQTLAAWKALVGGRYALVERVEADGKRFVVACENPPGVLDPRGLTRLEATVADWARRGHAQKQIAYELGLSAGTVANIISRVGRKLGVSSRAALVAALDRPTELERAAGSDGRELLIFSGRSGDPSAFAELGEAERTVARLAGDGSTNAEIAAARGTSERTVAHQLTSIYRKLGVGSRGELAARLRNVR